MGVGPEELQHLDQVIDIVVEIELAVGQRHLAGVAPVGDVDVGIGQQRLDRAAQQRRVVAGHRRHDEEARVLAMPLGQLALEMQQLTEGLLPDDLVLHRNALAVDDGLVQAEFRLAVDAGGALEQLGGGRHGAAHRHVGQGIQRVFVEQLRGVRGGAERDERGMVPFIEVVQHRLSLVLVSGNLAIIAAMHKSAHGAARRDAPLPTRLPTLQRSDDPGVPEPPTTFGQACAEMLAPDSHETVTPDTQIASGS